MPATRPVVPPDRSWEEGSLLGDVEPMSERERREQEAQRQRAAYRMAQLQSAQLWDEVTLMAQSARAAVMELYSEPPVPAELREMAKEILRDEQATASLLGEIEAKAARRGDAAPR